MNKEAQKKRRDYMKKYRLENKDTIKKYSKKWRNENKDKIKVYNDSYWEGKIERA